LFTSFVLSQPCYSADYYHYQLSMALIYSLGCMDDMWNNKYSLKDKVFEHRTDICECFGLGIMQSVPPEQFKRAEEDRQSPPKINLGTYKSVEKRCKAEYEKEDE
jgi:hypothetical protein